MSSQLHVSPTICLIGAGNMGGAMLGGWLAAGHDPATITVIDPKPPIYMLDLMAEHGVNHVIDAKDAKRPDLIVVAVKPQIMEVVLPGLVGLVDGENALVSVAAGTTIAQISAPFADVSPRIIRAMPNTPAMVQRGITVCVPNTRVSDAQRSNVTKVLSAIGAVEWVEDELLMDAVTGVSGSGPAYVFHLAEALAEAGEAAGLPVQLAATLAEATISGAGELMRQSELSPSQLRRNVTSPNGTTQAALEILMATDGFPDLLREAVAAAAKRSRELAG
ncbi:MAG: pyrroline-5-carboxylate reductase [Rhizobiaceae bacterium]|nr:pyrroline-5-carboxylate reductase [Rhizobiaceae bacterium]